MLDNKQNLANLHGRLLEAWGKFWLIHDRNTVSIPDYIKGNAKGTIKEREGYLLRQVEYGPGLLDWHYADDPEKCPISHKVLMRCRQYHRQLNYVAGITDDDFDVL